MLYDSNPEAWRAGRETKLKQGWQGIGIMLGVNSSPT